MAFWLSGIAVLVAPLAELASAGVHMGRPSACRSSGPPGQTSRARTPSKPLP